MTYFYVEDLFVEVFNTIDPIYFGNDYSAAQSFYINILNNTPLTANQAGFLLKILRKQQLAISASGITVGNLLENPVWKNPFRVIDLTRRAFVVEEHGKLSIGLKFPFSLKEIFEKEVRPISDKSNSSVWDHDSKTRFLDFYSYNLITIHNFLIEHKFEIDQSFYDALSIVEEVWNQQENILPAAIINNSRVELINAAEDSLNYWKNNQTGDLDKDMLLAKSMGFKLKLDHPPKNNLEKICISEETFFWFKNADDFFKIYKNTGGVIAVILDRSTKDRIKWISEFVASAEAANVDRNEIKVCFRDSKESSSDNINAWIKENNLGGSVENGKILIFQQKPAKWLFKNNIDVKMIVTNSYTPPMDTLTKSWISSHSCVCCISDIKPTTHKAQKFVNL
jgi:hypothetical protein